MSGVAAVRDGDAEEARRKMAHSRELSNEAERRLRAGQLDPALAQAKLALHEHEQNVAAMLVMAEVYYRLGRYELVQSVTSSALAVDPQRVAPVETGRAYN